MNCRFRIGPCAWTGWVAVCVYRVPDQDKNVSFKLSMNFLVNKLHVLVSPQKGFLLTVFVLMFSASLLQKN